MDVLILEQEDPEMESDYGWFDGWFQWSVVLFFWFLETVYLSKVVLEDLADFQRADIQYTRETNAEMLDNALSWAKLLGAALFYVFLLAGVGLGAASGRSVSLWGSKLICAHLSISSAQPNRHGYGHRSRL
jgi:hypothetical protein